MITYNVKITVWCLTLFSWAAASGCHWFKSDFSQRSLMKRSRASRSISIWIANQPITGSSMHLDMSMMCRQLAELRGEHQNGEEMGWEWLWVSWTQSWAPDGLVWVFHKLPICWDFHTVANSTGDYRGRPQKEQTSSCVQENALLMPALRGAWAQTHGEEERQKGKMNSNYQRMQDP